MDQLIKVRHIYVPSESQAFNAITQGRLFTFTAETSTNGPGKGVRNSFNIWQF